MMQAILTMKGLCYWCFLGIWQNYFKQSFFIAPATDLNWPEKEKTNDVTAKSILF